MSIWVEAFKMVWDAFYWAFCLMAGVIVITLIDYIKHNAYLRNERFTEDELNEARRAQAKARYRIELEKLQ